MSNFEEKMYAARGSIGHENEVLHDEIERLQADNAALRARVPAEGTVAVPIDLAKDAADCISQGHSSRYLASALQAILDAAAVDGGGE